MKQVIFFSKRAIWKADADAQLLELSTQRHKQPDSHKQLPAHTAHGQSLHFVHRMSLADGSAEAGDLSLPPI